MADPERPDAAEHELYERIPELERDETIAPRPEEEAADVQRGTTGGAAEDEPG